MPQPNKFTIEQINERKPMDSWLTAIRDNGTIKKYNGENQRAVLCRCKCGKEVTLLVYYITKGTTKSCGCFREYMSENGLCHRKFYPHIRDLHNCYFGMMSRCYNPLDSGYHNYGGRGVTVCDEWKSTYQNFLTWAIQTGYRKGLQLDKDIKVPGNKIYSPDTCIWATPKQQANNKRTSTKHEYNGKQLTIYEIAEIENLKHDQLAYYIYRKKTDIYYAVEMSKINTIKYGSRKKRN